MAVATSSQASRALALVLSRALSDGEGSCVLIWASPDGSAAPSPSTAGIEVVQVALAPSPYPCVPDLPLARLATQIAPMLLEYDVVYSFLSGHPAMHAVRVKRLSGAASPLFVTVVDELPAALFDMGAGYSEEASARRFAEAYQLKHCDLVVCPDPIRPAQLSSAAGCPLPDSVHTLSGDPASWDALRRDVEARARATIPASRRQRHPTTNPSVTVCLRHVDDTDHLSRARQSLARQTVSDFWVADSLAAARQTSSEYLLFLDASDVACPTLVERLLDAARCSGDDLLSAWSYGFDGAAMPFDLASDRTIPPPQVMHVSPGHDLIGAMLHPPNDTACLVRRDVFNAVDGFPEAPIGEAGSYALQIRVALAGYRIDVVPECLYFKRLGATHASSVGDILNGEAMRRVFDERCDPVHLTSLALAMQALDAIRSIAELKVQVRRRELERRFRVGRPHGRLRLVMLLSSWPYPPNTGCLLRWWAMIRFLGTRHDLTLVTPCLPEQSRHRQELLRYCRSIHAVGQDGDARLPGSDALPYLVGLRMSLRMREAVQAVPTHLYDAALVEQVFLAPYREYIDAPAILGEHNIESRLLMQTAVQDVRGTPMPGFENLERESVLLQEFEDRVWPTFDLRSAVSEPDRGEIERRSGGKPTILVENGTDLDLWLPDSRPDTGRILFLGMLGYYPNIDAVLYFWQEIWPLLHRLKPSMELIVAGSHPTEEIRSLAGRPGLCLVENPSDVRSVAARASLSIVPLRIGSGTRIKIINSMALGIPVVTTSIGCEGLSVRDGEHLLIRDEPEAFAEAVCEVIGDPMLWRTLRENARMLVEQRYKWDRVLEPLESALWKLKGP